MEPYFYTMRTILVLMIGLLFLGCQDHPKKTGVEAAPEVVTPGDDQPLESYDFEGLTPFLQTDTDKTYIVNFWATWCAPCIKELPHFEAVNKNYRNKGVEVLLVSLDFPNKYDSHVKPFIKKHQLKSKVIALDDLDSNTWIPAINPNWSGAIPATLIFNKDKRQFYEQPFTYEELEAELEEFLK